MILSLIGMSGSGKTHWAKQLEAAGFKRYSWDEMIEERLGDELRQLGYKGINDLAKWMGQPYEQQYAKNSATYLRLEYDVMAEIVAQAKKHPDEHSIIDTTGSVIYMPDALLKEMKSLSKLVYLYTPMHVQEEMFQLYLADPKPVIWGNSFTKRADESHRDALARCYPQLLAHRTEQYKKLANITMSYFLIHTDEFNYESFLEKVAPDYDFV